MTGFIDADLDTPIESAALCLNTLHRTDHMDARRREARVAAEGLLDVEVMARVLGEHACLVSYSGFRCKCGGWQYGSISNPVETFQKHLAESLRAALLGEGA